MTALGLVVAGLAGRTRPDLPAICLATLGISGLALGLTDYPAALAAATAAGLVGVMLAVTPGGDRAGATAGLRHLRAVVTAGAVAVLVVAWVDPDMTALGLAPPAFGLAYLAVALGVAIRFGAIPFHLWAARLTDVSPRRWAAARHGPGGSPIRDRRSRLGQRRGGAAVRRIRRGAGDRAGRSDRLNPARGNGGTRPG